MINLCKFGIHDYQEVEFNNDKIVNAMKSYLKCHGFEFRDGKYSRGRGIAMADSINIYEYYSGMADPMMLKDFYNRSGVICLNCGKTKHQSDVEKVLESLDKWVVVKQNKLNRKEKAKNLLKDKI